MCTREAWLNSYGCHSQGSQLSWHNLIISIKGHCNAFWKFTIVGSIKFYFHESKCVRSTSIFHQLEKAIEECIYFYFLDFMVWFVVTGNVSGRWKNWRGFPTYGSWSNKKESSLKKLINQEVSTGSRCLMTHKFVCPFTRPLFQYRVWRIAENSQLFSLTSPLQLQSLFLFLSSYRDNNIIFLVNIKEISSATLEDALYNQSLDVHKEKSAFCQNSKRSAERRVE